MPFLEKDKSASVLAMLTMKVDQYRKYTTVLDVRGLPTSTAVNVCVYVCEGIHSILVACM